MEIEGDPVWDGEQVFVAEIKEQMEAAVIHSGDSACSLPPYTLARSMLQEIERQAARIAQELRVIGLMNVQFAVQGEDIYILEVNPRASRTVPFVAQATGVPIAKIPAGVMAGARLSEFNLERSRREHVALKEAVFPFARFPGVDVVLGPEMKSTGEVMGIDRDFARAFLKSQLGAGVELPTSGRVFISVKDSDKPDVVKLAQELTEAGFDVIATAGTAAFLQEQGLTAEFVHKVHDGHRPHVVDRMIDGAIQLVINTTETRKAVADSFSLRRSALTNGIPYYTTIAGAEAAVQAILAARGGLLEVAPLQSYFEGAF